MIRSVPIALCRLEAENGSRKGWIEAVTEYSPGTGFRYEITAEGGSGLRLVETFRFVGPLVATATALRRIHDESHVPLTEALELDLPRLARLRVLSGWLSRDSASLDPLTAILVEMLNSLFLLDANALFFGAGELRRHGTALLHTLAAVGEIDAAVAIASYRAGATAWTRPVLRPPRSAVTIQDLGHPLLPDGVPNSIDLAPPHGVLITGSNMSGKSTFLRSLGLATVLGQTVNTCIAKRYDAPQLTVRSCIGRSDDLLLGKSYYLDEVQRVIDVIRASHSNRAHLILLDELFRGTNAIERIAAGEATLRELATTAHLVICATHDVEIVAFLEGIYASFHFVDRMEPEGLVFEYQLAVGPSTTRNAISLLELNGAPEALVFRARERAAHLSALRQTDAQTSAHSVRSLNDQSSQRAVFSDLPSSTSALHLRHVLSATSTFGVSRQPSADRGVTPPARHVHSAGDHETALPALSFHRHHAPTDPSHAFTPAAWPSRPGDKQVMLGDRILDYFPAQSLRAISICRSSQMSPAPRLHPAR